MEMVGALRVSSGGRRSWVMVLVCLLVLVLVLVVVAGVGWFSFRGDDDVPFDDASLVVSLGDGFTVAEGTELAGTVFPGTEPNGWFAHLVLIGNPVVVMNRYLDQARDGGFLDGGEMFDFLRRIANAPAPRWVRRRGVVR